MPTYEQYHHFVYTEDLEAVYLSPQFSEYYEISERDSLRYFTRFLNEESRFVQNLGAEKLAKIVWYLFGSMGGHLYALRDQQIPIVERFAAIEAIGAFYADIENHPAMKDAELGANPLTTAVYMIWDMDSGLGDFSDGEVGAAQLRLIRRLLESENPIIQRSALHGLVDSDLDSVTIQEIITTFIDRRGSTLRSDVLAVASEALELHR